MKGEGQASVVCTRKLTNKAMLLFFAFQLFFYSRELSGA